MAQQGAHRLRIASTLYLDATAQPIHQLGGRRDTEVRGEQNLFDLLPGVLVDIVSGEQREQALTEGVIASRESLAKSVQATLGRLGSLDLPDRLRGNRLRGNRLFSIRVGFWLVQHAGCDIGDASPRCVTRNRIVVSNARGVINAGPRLVGRGGGRPPPTHESDARANDETKKHDGDHYVPGQRLHS